MNCKPGTGLTAIIIIVLLTVLGTSCSKNKTVLGNFHVKGRFLNMSGTPRANTEVYVEYVDNASGTGGSSTRKKVGNSLTDSLGYFKFECTLYGGVDYRIEPPGYNITPTPGDTIDIGVKKW